MVVNVDPVAAARGPRDHPGGARPAADVLRADLLGGERYRWTIGRNFVRLGPGQAHVLKVETHA